MSTKKYLTQEMDKEHAKPCISTQNKALMLTTVRDDVKLTPYYANKHPIMRLAQNYAKRQTEIAPKYTKLLDPAEKPANRKMVHLTPLDGRQDFHRPC